MRLKRNNGTEKKLIITYDPESYGRMVDSYLATYTGSETLKKILTILVDNPGTVWKCIDKDISLLFEDEDIEYLISNLKCRDNEVCNAMETLLVAKSVSPPFSRIPS